MSANASSDNSKMSSAAKSAAKASKTATPAAAAPAVAAPAPVVEAAAPKATKGKKAAAAAAPAVAAPAPVVAAPATDATVTAPVAEEDVATKLSKAVARSAEIAHQQKTLASEAAAVAKEIEKLTARLAKKAAGRRKRAAGEGSTSNNGKAFITPVPITNELAAFLGLEKGALISRRDVSKRIYAYAKSHNLQKGKVINTDASLRKLLGVTEKDEVTILNLQKHINKHYIKPTPAAN